MKKKNKIYIDDRPPKIPEWMEAMSLEEIEKYCEELTKKEKARLEKIKNQNKKDTKK